MGKEPEIAPVKYAKTPDRKTANGCADQASNYFKKSNNELAVVDV